MKSLVTIALGTMLGVFGTLFTLNWQEESLSFQLSETAIFGDVVYQNVRIVNSGWNPAENVRIIVERPEIGVNAVKASMAVSSDFIDGRYEGFVDRIRRDESVTLAFAFRGNPILASDITIKSDRSIAKVAKETESGWLDWTSFLFGVGAWFFLFLFLAITIPAYKDYQKRGRKAVEKTQQKPDAQAT